MNENTQNNASMIRVLRHRLRNIASGVKAATTLLAAQLDDRLTPSEKEYFPLIIRECDGLAELALRLSLLMDAVPEGKPGLLGEILARALHEFRARYPLVHINSIHEAGSENAVISSDLGLLAALKEILNNAAESSLFGKQPSASRNVTIRCLCNAETVAIIVQDGGPGIPENEWSGALQPFRKARADHLGIGLAIANRSVAAMRGILQAQSDEAGFSVVIRLPLLAQSESAPDPAAATKRDVCS